MLFSDLSDLLRVTSALDSSKSPLDVASTVFACAHRTRPRRVPRLDDPPSNRPASRLFPPLCISHLYDTSLASPTSTLICVLLDGLHPSSTRLRPRYLSAMRVSLSTHHPTVLHVSNAFSILILPSPLASVRQQRRLGPPRHISALVEVSCPLQHNGGFLPGS